MIDDYTKDRATKTDNGTDAPKRRRCALRIGELLRNDFRNLAALLTAASQRRVKSVGCKTSNTNKRNSLAIVPGGSTREKAIGVTALLRVTS